MMLMTGAYAFPQADLLYLGNRAIRTELDADALAQTVQCGSSAPVDARQRVLRTVGNSHSAHILPMLEVIGDQCGLRVLSEPDPDFIDIPSGGRFSPEKLDPVFAPLAAGDVLILSSRYRRLYAVPHLNGRGDRWLKVSTDPSWRAQLLKRWLEAFDAIIDRARSSNIRVVLFLPNVEFDQQVLPYDGLCQKQWFQLPKTGCNPSVSRRWLEQRFPEAFFAAVNERARNETHLFLFDPLPVYCGEASACARIVDEVVAFDDTNHLTPAGSLLMLEEFNGFLLTNGLMP